MQTAPQHSLYLLLLISRLPGWGSPLEKVRFFSKRNMIAGSSLQIGPTTSHSCSGEATPLGTHLFKWNTSTAGKKNPTLLLKVWEIRMTPASRNQGTHVAWQNGPFSALPGVYSEQGFLIGAFPEQMLASRRCYTHQQPEHERTPHVSFQIKVGSRAHGARKRL